MNLQMNVRLADGYKSKSQIARVITEDWLSQQVSCPSCGNPVLQRFKNNQPAADFYCENCREEFELKSKQGKIQNTIVDGAYTSMLMRVQADNNPNFFLLTYNAQWIVNNFLVIPKHFFTPSIVIQRAPLSATAKRAGWIGCNIDISQIPDTGKIYLIKNSQIKKSEQVKQDFAKALFLRKKSQSARGWILDVMRCIEAIPKDLFSLSDVYAFEASLRQKYPNNRFVKDKIRQQLQLLRDQGIIDFVGSGIYRKMQNLV